MHAKLRVAAKTSKWISKISVLKLKYKIALLLVFGCVLWFSSGLFLSRKASQDAVFGTADISKIVDVRKLRPEHRKVIKLLPAKVHASKSVMIVSEVNGKVEKIFLDGGSAVKKNQAILKIEERGKFEQLERADSLLKQRKIERDATESLSDAGYRTAAHDHAASVALKDAEVNYKNALLDFENTTIRAPFPGIVDEILPQVGSMVSIGQPIATVANFDKLKVVAYISEDEMSHVKIGDDAEVILGGEDQVLHGTVSFMGRILSPETKSCRLEILVNNKGAKTHIADGMSAKARVTVRKVKAYKLPSSSISLDSGGNMGIKVVGNDGVVQFLEVDIVDDDGEGKVWVSGINEDEIALIVHGHEYVVNGAIIGEYNT